MTTQGLGHHGTIFLIDESGQGRRPQIEDFLGIANFNYPQALLERRYTESVKHEMPDFFVELIAPAVARIHEEIKAEGFALPAKWTAVS